MSAPLVTIGIPCFNAERWIAGAVRSALEQTWVPTEVIVVDDGSTDGSLARLAEFGESIRVIQGVHRGGNPARNEILAAARGAWVQFLDADDYLEPEKIERQFSETAGGAEADVIYSPVWIETTTGGANDRQPSATSPEADIFTQWLSWHIPQTGGALWRKAMLDALGGWKVDQPCCQEHELYLRALQAGARFVFAPTAHAVYRVWSEETVCRKDPRRLIEVKAGLVDRLRAWLDERGGWTSEHRRVAGQVCFEMARTLAQHDPAAAAAYHRDRKERGLIHLAGAAAPLAYRLIYRTAGFTMAERLAAMRR